MESCGQGHQLSDRMSVPRELQVRAKVASLRSRVSRSSRYTHPSGSNPGQGKDMVPELYAVVLNSEGLQPCFEKFDGCI